MQIELAEKNHKISRECQQICKADNRKVVESLHLIFFSGINYKVTQAQNWGIHLLFVKALINNTQHSFNIDIVLHDLPHIE